jgi:hypothetical protein
LAEFCTFILYAKERTKFLRLENLSTLENSGIFGKSTPRDYSYVLNLYLPCVTYKRTKYKDSGILYLCTFYIPFLLKPSKPSVQVVCLYVTEAKTENTNYFLETQA